ncbi:hypothetical protein AZI85_15455 [Bdellovibrio bacteriovorus]|uniref:Ferritin-like domain-containing protein n=1 Tax=Bdellovibrio bacteriovorus TaxID=959 RepID=A0A150WUG8_BDEBC|nr:ferritin-like domain-containing protein [Bdellovibrio bacteriovorus]KYG70083.1 hypothetical protein AZI85_15455 [Bdellovibrio bacteriovorus]
MRTSIEQLYNSINKLMSQVCKDPRLESALLTALGHMEDLAAKQILGNVSASTPPQFLSEIRVHAEDELRHRDALWAVRPFAEAKDARELELRRDLQGIAESFTVGYFGNPILIQAKSRFNAYVHGALTIEQFPFQIYSCFIKATYSESVRSVLTSVLADEKSHIQLGKKMMETLPETEKLCLTQLHTIEKEMCHKMVLRMSDVISAYENHTERRDTLSASEKLGHALSADAAATSLWIYALGDSEELAANHMQEIFRRRHLPLPVEMVEHVQDEKRHAQLLRQTVLLRRRKYLQQPKYKVLEVRMRKATERYLVTYFSHVMKKFSDPEEIYLYGALGLEMRVFKHYAHLSETTHSIDVAFILDEILKDEAEHTQMVHLRLRDRGYIKPEILKWIRQTEEICFERAASQVLGGLFCTRTWKESAAELV